MSFLILLYDKSYILFYEIIITLLYFYHLVRKVKNNKLFI